MAISIERRGNLEGIATPVCGLVRNDMGFTLARFFKKYFQPCHLVDIS